MAEKTITKDDITNNVISFVEQIMGKSWNAKLRIHGFPLRFDVKAFETLLLTSTKIAVDLTSTATGVAFIRGHDDITEEDVITAIEVKQRGADAVLPPPGEADNWN